MQHLELRSFPVDRNYAASLAVVPSPANAPFWNDANIDPCCWILAKLAGACMSTKAEIAMSHHKGPSGLEGSKTQEHHTEIPATSKSCRLPELSNTSH